MPHIHTFFKTEFGDLFLKCSYGYVYVYYFCNYELLLYTYILLGAYCKNVVSQAVFGGFIRTPHLGECMLHMRTSKGTHTVTGTQGVMAGRKKRSDRPTAAAAAAEIMKYFCSKAVSTGSGVSKPWLVYNKAASGGFCKFCALFSKMLIFVCL